ncbi:hypothetical protein CDAR_417741 [Caerostris darwini]|uniref:Uncharacterized protein n=1 Tax=Caerostris darwini TaxID=1538125 RepID=A0AAV4PSH9_9ARAC|nr:hypothetical protein CDAR_417741 [Caerostris darwini]
MRKSDIEFPVEEHIFDVFAFYSAQIIRNVENKNMPESVSDCLGEQNLLYRGQILQSLEQPNSCRRMAAISGLGQKGIKFTERQFTNGSERKRSDLFCHQEKILRTPRYLTLWNLESPNQHCLKIQAGKQEVLKLSDSYNLNSEFENLPTPRSRLSNF